MHLVPRPMRQPHFPYSALSPSGPLSSSVCPREAREVLQITARHSTANTAKHGTPYHNRTQQHRITARCRTKLKSCSSLPTVRSDQPSPDVIPRRKTLCPVLYIASDHGLHTQSLGISRSLRCGEQRISRQWASNGLPHQHLHCGRPAPPKNAHGHEPCCMAWLLSGLLRCDDMIFRAIPITSRTGTSWLTDLKAAAPSARDRSSCGNTFASMTWKRSLATPNQAYGD
jgi:hypothetical protein